MFANLADQRRFGDRVLLSALWAAAPVIGLATAAAKGPWLMTALGAAGLAGAATALNRIKPDAPATRMSVAVALMGSVSLLVGGMAGRPWQVDLHMAYFAALASLILYCDWSAVAAGALAVGAHHLVLSFILPAAVFPGGGDLRRVLIHAVVLVIEAAALMWGSRSVAQMFDATAANLNQSREAQREAEAAREAAEVARFAESHAADERQSLQFFVEEERLSVVNGLAEALGRLAQGDMGCQIGAAFPPEYEQLRADFNGAIGRLSGALTDIIAAASAIRSGAGQMTVAADDLARRTERQAASLEETAAALDQITSTVRKTASGAEACSDVVLAARGDAQTSGQVVAQAVNAMSEIETSSSQIGQIIGVIDEIAFQTNLLALNAGVEAARAGEAGKGFAVVAAEVRALAQRSAEAAKEIKALVGASSAQVESGVRLVGETGRALQRIVDRVAEIEALVAEIAASTQEQSVSLGQVNQAINHMDQVTQQNAAMVEQSTAASHALAKEAEGLADAVARFRVEQPAATVATTVGHSPVMAAYAEKRAVARGAVAALLKPTAPPDEWEEF
ncbi:methyl-accepting chemotaxis protein [Phenylobacterium aquaticum]|uniref:methyl-accepting chemotaxis protein n=1 Tax=Phenylobacterium aquaticum TaxID=1763816 RepID=UPI0026EDDF16|nr:methyl-accepting chemotaxis protein [Phenylobacterium aquaticum]